MKWQIVIAIILIVLLIYFETKKTEIIMSVAKTVSNLTRSDFIAKYSKVVKDAAKGTGLFPSLFMAQAALESANGNSGLTKDGNNFFGIKADKNWKGKTITKKTREVINGKEIIVDAKFRAYDKPEDSFRDRVKFLQQNSRYANAGVFTAKTPEQQAQALQNAGYATDPNYAKVLSDVVHNYSLKTLDA
jgi:flagellum-specific peptidoglycan hydrolase FlgJ